MQTVPGGPADLAGFFKAGDFIVSINGLKIRHFEKPDGIYKFLNATRDHADLVVFNVSFNSIQYLFSFGHGIFFLKSLRYALKSALTQIFSMSSKSCQKNLTIHILEEKIA